MIQASFALTATFSVLAAENPKLQVGVPLIGAISADAPSHPSPAGVNLRESAPWPGVTLPLVIEHAGPHFLTLRSSDFDAYLVLKDADGKAIAEDDDGFFGTHARIETAALAPGSKYTLDVLTPEGFGDFTLALDAVSPPKPSPEEALKIGQGDLERAEAHDDRPFQVAHANLAVAVAAKAAGLSNDALVSANRAEQAYSEELAGSLRRRVEQSFAVFVKAGHPDDLDHATRVRTDIETHYALGEREGVIPLLERLLDMWVRVVGEESGETDTILRDLAIAHFDLGHYEEALRLNTRVLELQIRINGEEDPRTAATLFRLAWTHYRLGHHDEAIRFGQRTLEIFLRTLGDDHADTAYTLAILEASHAALGHHDEAIHFGLRALDIRLRLLGEDHVDTAKSLNNIAVAHSALGHYDEALRFGQRALDILIRVLGEDHALTAQSLASLADFHGSLGHHSEALRLGQRALDIQLRILGEDHALTARTLAILAHAVSALGHHDEAIRFGQRAVDIRLRLLGEDHVDTAQTLFNLALAHSALGRHDDSIRLGRRALEIQLRIQGPVGPDTTLTLKNLVGRMTEPGDQAALEALLVDYHRRCVEAFGATDPRVAPSVARLAILRWRNNDRERAVESLDAAIRLGGWENAAADHGNENVLFRLAEILRELGRIADARIFAGYSVDLMLRFHPGDERSNEHRALLADILLDLGSFADAEKEYSLALDGFREKLGDDDPNTQYVLFGLARAVQDQGRSPDAETHLRKLLAICERTLPKDHEFLQDVRLRLAEALRAQGKQDEADRVQETVTVATVYRPALLVNTPDRLETTTEQRSIALDAVITDYSGVADVKIVRDGFAISIRSLEEQAEQLGKYVTPDKTGQKATLHFPIYFQEGQSAIELVVSAQNRRGQWSDPQTFRITYQPPQRDLYLLAFGVQDYDDDALDLSCPIADVDGIIAAMTAQEGAFFSKVHVKRLVDREVTNGEMKRAVDQFLVAAQPRDTIIVFAAGHGVRTEHSDYYFLTSNTTPANPYDGIDRPTIESLVTSNKLHAQRRLLLLDTCHAGGEAPGETGTRAGAIRTLVQQDEVNKFKAADDATGLYILASSTDDSFAREANGNGLFTRAFLDGLNGEADSGALGDGNGFVEIEELKNYIYFQVLETSQGKQRATVPKVIAGENFPIGRSKNGASR